MEHEKRLPRLRLAAGAQITQSRHGEVVTKHTDAGLCFCNRNGNVLKQRWRTHWRANLVPAAAVIPVPIADIEVVAVKKFVVEMPREQIC